jgi:hypothetical protein
MKIYSYITRYKDAIYIYIYNSQFDLGEIVIMADTKYASKKIESFFVELQHLMCDKYNIIPEISYFSDLPFIYSVVYDEIKREGTAKIITIR